MKTINDIYIHLSLSLFLFLPHQLQKLILLIIFCVLKLQIFFSQKIIFEPEIETYQHQKNERNAKEMQKSFLGIIY